MKLSGNFLAFALSAVCLSACATQPDAAAPVEKRIAFTSATAADSIIVTLRDNNARFVISDPGGRVVYEDAVSLSVLGWEKPPLPWTHDLAAERLWLKSVPLAEMEGDLVARTAKGVGAFWPISDNDALDRAKKADRPLLCYVSAPDGYTCAWYDDATRSGVRLIEGAS